MYLKRLEIHGFKSIADKTELHLQPGVSAVIGPNGCGKSNISDAIRWVLGEQSIKNLRGAKMEDVIFAGSDKRKQVGMAEVSMTLDNSDGAFPLDFSEITVTRRVYRSGESEYLINKTACRLKDIHELFMDTGIGREGYSIISQGKIDEILSVKSEDRRMIIEEAAGIVKFKSRKQQAVRKLSDTEQNMVRINDIIQELANQVGPLEEQSAKAQEYLGYKNELTELEINLLAHQIGEQKQRLQEMESQDDKVRLELVESETGLRNIESQLEEQKFNITILDEEISAAQRDVYEIGSLTEKQESEMKLSHERIKNSQEQTETLNKEILELEEKKTSEMSRHSGDEDSLEKIRETIRASEEALAGLEGSLSEAEERLTSDLEAHENDKANIIDLLNETANIKNSIHAYESTLQGHERRKMQLAQQLESQDQELESAANHEKETMVKVEGIKNNLNDLAEKDKALVSHKEKLTIQIDDLNRKLSAANRLFQEKSSRLKVLHDLQRDFEGYYKGVKEALKASRKGHCSGICGVIAEAIKVASEHETAVEIALGGAIQNIITETDNDARKAIEYLKKNNLGRATFLPINTVRGNKERDVSKYSKYNGFVGLASELVKVDPKYINIIEHLLGRILVVTDIRCASEIARAAGHSLRIVTLDGDVINPGGAMTGGSYSKNSSGLLSRSREIDEITAEIEKVKTAIERENKSLADQKAELDNCVEEISRVRTEGNNLTLELTSHSKELEAVSREKQRIVSNSALLKDEHAFVQTEIEQTLEKMDEQKIKLTELQFRDSEIKKRIEAQKGTLSVQEQERDSILEQITVAKVELAKLTQEEVNYAQIMHRVIEIINDLQTQIARKQAQIEEYTSNIRIINEEIHKMQVEIKSLNQQKGLKEEQLSELRNRRQAGAAFVSEKESILRQVSKNIERLKEQIHASEVKKARLEIEVENALNKLSEEYNCTYEEAFLRKTETINKKEISGRIKELKESISSIGDVNIGSIEEYARVKERYEFLSKQYEDLEQARNALYKVIGEMDEIMTQRFSDSFAIINASFSDVFARLFGGGRAQLILADPDNILESGIEIIAQPPGKKNQHLSLLSGGEKALTAISLLLAILQNKPSPFCVLDEIEAALDEANVERYAAFIKEFSQSTQFIVITHRKGTMEVADALYGVTMDESRVTKLVSMKLSEAMEKVS